MTHYKATRPDGTDFDGGKKGAEVNYEAMRIERGWPMPEYLRRVADALDTLSAARSGGVLRWFADLCDDSLRESVRPQRKPKGCKKCGRETFRGEQFSARREPLRCGGCGYTTGRCKCLAIASLA